MTVVSRSSKSAKSVASAKAAAAAKAIGSRGRPARRVYINVSVRESTRKAMNTLRIEQGITQGELLDQLLAGKLHVQ